MNWTGGRLQRHSKANKNEVLQRQEQHFARVRQQLQSGKPFITPVQSKRTSRSIWERDGSVASRDNTYNSLTGGEHLRQTKLEHYRNTARVAHRLAIMSERSASLATRSEVTQMSPALAQKFNDDPRLKISRGSQATDPSRRASRADLALEQSRKRLLEQSDWAGLNLARPSKIASTPHHDREHLGKRRRVEKTKRRAHVCGAPGYSNALVPVVEDFNDDEQFYMRGALQPVEDHISIRIGQEVPLSQVVIDTKSHRADSDHGDVQSDAMLFEDDTAVSDTDDAGDLSNVQQAVVEPDHHQREFSSLTKSACGKLRTRSAAGSAPPDNAASDWQSEDGVDPGQGHVITVDLREPNDIEDPLDDPEASVLCKTSQYEGGPTPKGVNGNNFDVNPLDAGLSEAESESPFFQSPGPPNTQQELSHEADAHDPVLPGKACYDGSRDLKSRGEQREHVFTTEVQTYDYNGQAEPEQVESDPNTIWKRFIFDDSSSSMTCGPPAHLDVIPATRTEPASSLFVNNSSSSRRHIQSSTFAGNPNRLGSGAKSSRARRRPAHRDLNNSDSISAASDAALMFREVPEPLVWTPTEKSSDHATAPGASVVAASMINNLSMLSTEVISTDRLQSGSDLRGEGSSKPTAFNVQLTSNAKHLSSTYAGRKDARPAPVKSTRPAQCHDEDKDSSHVATIHQSPVHAKAARARPGPERIGAAGDAERGKHIVKQTKRNASSLPSGSSIYDFPYSDSVDNNGLVE